MKNSEKFENKSVLITGGLGFIGSNLARELVKYGCHVTLVDNLIPEYGGSLFNISGIEEKVTVNISDVRDPHSMHYLIQGKDYLFNLAGQTSHMDSMLDPFSDLDINARSQLSILEACRNYNPAIRIVFASTRQIYGRPDYLPVDENHLVRPVDVNGINKAAGESYHLLYNNVYGIRASVLRLTNTYGLRMRVKDARQTFVGIWIRLLIESRPFEVWGGEQLRDFNYVDDVIDAMLTAAVNEKAYGEIFNLGHDQRISLKDLADLLIEVNGKGEYALKSFPEDRKKIDIGDYYSDWKKINEVLGWKPKTDLLEGLGRTMKYYKNHINHYL